MLTGLVALDLILGLGFFWEMEEYSCLRAKKKKKKQKNPQIVESIKIINSEVDLLSYWMVVPTALGAPVPKTIFIVPIQCWVRA